MGGSTAGGEGGGSAGASAGAAGNGNAGANALGGSGPGGSDPGGGAGAAGSGPVVCPGPLSPSMGPIAAGIVTFTGSDGVVRGVDRTEVTAAQFKPFRDSLGSPLVGGTGACEGAALNASGDAVCQPDLPVYASFCTAKAFCAWSGKALCGAADWGQACSNGGTTTFATGASLAPGCKVNAAHAATSSSDCHGAAPPFDMVFDMSGNLPEWTDECVQPPPWEAGALVRCRVRGGGAGSSEADLDCAPEAGNPSELVRIDQLAGFRCCEPPVCLPGAQQACYSGPAGTLGVGLCRGGLSSCLADGTGFGPCVGEVVPTGEVCATEGDDDCDGDTNEDGADCACAPGSVAPCYAGPPSTKGIGDCHGGTQICNAAGSGYGACTGEIVPQPETCATIGDEDCDGVANEAGGLGCVCVPGTTAPCYEGAAGTEGVGACRGGTKTCLPTGGGYGACGGAQVLPASSETCGNHLDDTCDGVADPQGPGQACGGVGFAKSFGEGPYSPIEALALDESGHVIVGGPFDNTLTVAPGITLTEAAFPAVEGFLAAYDATGTHVWSRKVAGPPVGIARVAGGSIVALQQVINEPSGLQRAAARVLRLSLTGADVWSTPIVASDGAVLANAVAATSDGGAMVTASFRGTITLAGSTLQAVDDGKTQGLVVARFGPTGAAVWAKQLGGASTGGASTRVGVDATDAVYVAFDGEGLVDFGDTIGGPIATKEGSRDICVVKLSSAGAWQRSACYGDGLEQRVLAMAVDPAGTVVLGGITSGAIDFGLGPVVPSSGPSGTNGFMVRFEPTGTAALSVATPSPTGLAFRGSEILVTDARGLHALGSDGRPRSAFLPIAPVYSPFGLPTPSGGTDVYVGGWTNLQLKLDVGGGVIPGADGISTGVWARLPL